MFPLSYKHTFKIDIANQQISLPNILLAFEKHLYNPQIKPGGKILFNDLNVFLKHRWLDNGELEVYEKDGHLYAELKLNFYSTPIILFFFSLFGLVFSGVQNIWVSLCAILVFWFTFFLLYLWTVSLFKGKIKSVLNIYIA